MFKKKSYSDLEVQEMMETLFLEKKKVQELQLKLNNCSLSPSITPTSNEINALNAEIKALSTRLEEGKNREKTLENQLLDLSHLKLEFEQNTFKAKEAQNEIEKLKLEIQSYKVNNQSFSIQTEEIEKQKAFAKKEIEKITLDFQALQRVNESTEKERERLSLELQKLEKALQETAQDKQKEAQLERVVQFMRARLEEAQFENHELLQKCREFEEKEQKFQEELNLSKNVQQKLTESFHKENQEKEALLEEETALKGQIQQLRDEVLKSQGLISTQKNEGNEHKEALANSYKEIDLLKTMMMKTLQESKEERLKEEKSYQIQIENLTNDKEIKLQEIEHLTKKTLEQNALLEQRAQDLEASEKQVMSFTEELEHLKRAHLELVKFSEELQAKLIHSEQEKSTTIENLLKKEELINNLSSQVANLSRSYEKIEETMRQNELTGQEHEARLRAAQNHLAKKMRELAHAHEQNEGLKHQLDEQERTLETSKNKLIETKALLDAENQQKTKIEKQYQEGLKTLETQALKWEEKYFQMQEKWQETEARNRELKRLEDKFGKLQNLFNNLGSILSAPLSIDNQEPIKQEMSPIKKFSEVEILSKEDITAVTQSHSSPGPLFEKAPSASRYKETLFG